MEGIWKSAASKVIEAIHADGRRQKRLTRKKAADAKTVLADPEKLKVVLMREDPDIYQLLFDENGAVSRTGAGVIATAAGCGEEGGPK